LNEYTRWYKEVCIWVYQATRQEVVDCNTKLESCIIVKILGLHDKTPNRLIKAFFYINNFLSSLGDNSILLIRAPTPLVIPIWLYSYKRNNILLYLVGDYTRNISDLRFSFTKNLLIKLLAYYVDGCIKRLIYKRPFITNSQQLFDKYSRYSNKGKVIKSSTLTEFSFFKKDSKPFHQTLKGLFVGRVDYSKGIAELVEAVKILYAQNIIIELTLAGPILRNNPDVKTFVVEKYLGQDFLKNIRFVGEVSFGEELNDLYRSSDFFIIPSKSEGFPRVIWEAFANDLPVICSKVGSIPHFLRDGMDAIFINHVTPEEIAKSILYVINNPDTVSKIINNGKKLALENTVENQVKLIYNFIELNFGK